MNRGFTALGKGSVSVLLSVLIAATGAGVGTVNTDLTAELAEASAQTVVSSAAKTDTAAADEAKETEAPANNKEADAQSTVKEAAPAEKQATAKAEQTESNEIETAAPEKAPSSDIKVKETTAQAENEPEPETEEAQAPAAQKSALPEASGDGETHDTINVVFKYYDRSTEGGAPMDIKRSPTSIVVPVYVEDRSESTITQAVTDAMSEKGSSGLAVNDITNVLDEYYFWPSQTEAESSFGGLTNHHNNEQSYSSSGVELAYHADYYGYTFGEEGYRGGTSPEKWVTYYSDDNVVDVLNNETAQSIDEIVVWGFNTPKTYTVTAYFPLTSRVNYYTLQSIFSQDYIGENSNTLKNAVYTVVGTIDQGYMEMKFKYGECIGDISNDSNPRTFNYSVGDYFNHVYDIGNDASLNGRLPGHTQEELAVLETFEQIDLYVDEDPENTMPIDFIGWYACTYKDDLFPFDKMFSDFEESDFFNVDNTVFSKVSTDLSYKGRVTSNMVLMAGYNMSNSPELEFSSKGLSLLSNDVEHYSTSTEISENDYFTSDYVRYVNTIEPFGFDTSASNITNVAIIYCLVTPNNGEDITENDFYTTLRLSDGDRNSLISHAEYAMVNKQMYVVPQDPLPTYIVRRTGNNVSNLPHVGSMRPIIIPYRVVRTAANGDLILNDNHNTPVTELESDMAVLTDLNTTQFTVNFSSSVAENDILVFAAIRYTEVENGYLTYHTEISENYARYMDGEFYYCYP